MLRRIGAGLALHPGRRMPNARESREGSMSFLVALAALVFLMFVAYRGFSVILFAPVAFTSLFTDKMVGFAKLQFPVFLLGAMLGKERE
jgi:uncharacterized membrane protein YbhN (UPF0104 family)